MGRLALRPGLRAYVHAPVVETAAGWSDSTKAIEFNPASSQYAQATALAFDPGQPYSVSLWYRNPDADTSATGSAVSYGTLFCDGTGTLATQGRFIVNMSYSPSGLAPGAKISGHEGEGGNSFVRSNFNYVTFLPTHPLFRNIQANEWNHIVFTSTSNSSAAGTIKLYWNGVEVISTTGKAYAGSNHDTKPTIGAAVFFGSTNSYFSGSIDQVATYQRALSAADVAALLGPDNFDRKPQTPYLSTGGPIHLWAMGEYVSGSTMQDQIGSVDMTLYNSPTVSTSVAPAAYDNRFSTRFDGVDDYFTSSSSPVDVTGAFSVSLWCKVTTPQAAGFEGIFALTDSSTNDRLIISKFKSSSGATEQIGFRLSTTDGAGGNYSSRTIYSGAGTTALTKWRHIVFTGSATSSASGTQHLYLDGVQATIGSSTMSQLDAAANINEAIVGAFRNVNVGVVSYFLDGSVDEISCWPRVLSQAEVTALYNSGNPTDPMNTTGVTADAVAYYRLGDRWNRGTVPDVIGSADLTMSSAPVPEEDVP